MKTVFACLFLVLLALVALFPTFGERQQNTAPAAKAKKIFQVQIEASSSTLFLTPVLGGEIPASLEVYVNGMPPFAYKVSDASRYNKGSRCVIPLNAFVDKKGNRFNPFASAPVEVWVGGAGYDYKQHLFSR